MVHEILNYKAYGLETENKKYAARSKATILGIYKGFEALVRQGK